MCACSADDIRDFAFFVFERMLSQPRRHLHSHLAMQRLRSETTTTCPNNVAPGLPEHDQTAAISFFQWSSNHQVINRYVVYVDHTFIA